MRVIALLLVAGACGSPTKVPPADRGKPAVPATAAPDRRCLPVVAKACGCVYSCGTGVHAGDHWTVTHAFWDGNPLRAKVEPWCAGAACTDAFAAEIVCSVICAPKPADPTCHFDASGGCIGAGG